MGKPKRKAAPKAGAEVDTFAFDEHEKEEKNYLAELSNELRGHLSKGSLDKSATLKTLKVG